LDLPFAGQRRSFPVLQHPEIANACAIDRPECKYHYLLLSPLLLMLCWNQHSSKTYWSLRYSSLPVRNCCHRARMFFALSSRNVHFKRMGDIAPMSLSVATFVPFICSSLQSSKLHRTNVQHVWKKRKHKTSSESSTFFGALERATIAQKT
jgi:hypothetical protein